MAENRIPFRHEQDICRTGTSDATHLFNIAPILDDAHKSCDTVIFCAVHHFVYNISFCDAVVWKSKRFIINHYCDRALVLDLFADRLTCKFAKVHAFRNFITFSNFLCCFSNCSIISRCSSCFFSSNCSLCCTCNICISVRSACSNCCEHSSSHEHA